MTGIVLALAGLTCGDGGMGVGATSEPVTLSANLGDGFKGHMRLPDGTAFRVEMEGPTFRAWPPGRRRVLGDCELRADGPGRFRLEWGDTLLRGAVRRERQGVTLVLDAIPDDELKYFLEEKYP
jgi:hypothetical protein